MCVVGGFGSISQGMLALAWIGLMSQVRGLIHEGQKTVNQPPFYNININIKKKKKKMKKVSSNIT